ncbi:phospholipase [Bradyrhizobium sp. WBAH42]|nr:phospholipase [Bradyrhizobium sp. WBAH30]MDD1546831.1 phospholipase [Bradyrhizobium sp. WBAH41]MDD1559548.1 phospholipase [Bradyrhizobium sp. WBAH23]MDD1567064.1 phospholipase [Bradyrhizobium sp. WBAH33]MDD1592143.1 phospholipase [Bradyrhizobium sp. WBAH42]NRB91449.1 phospholipase [Bradyrhizobium sp. WBAH10]QCJ91381.1 phospholipase [Bradyrhizobium yuanmingense]
MAVLNDAAAYFAALREALLEAQDLVYIIGWDIHSRTRLVGAAGRADDGLPEELGPFLRALVQRRPALRINILVWDFVSFYASEREWNSAAKFIADTDGRVRFHLDATLPFGSAQHQKIVCVDGSLAFVGGLDLTIRRWDTSDHRADNAMRCDPQRKPYPPFHDVQCLVDGEAAEQLFALAEQRWRAAGQQVDERRALRNGRWPASVPVEAEHLPVGIARTEVVCPAGSTIREVERSFIAAIRSATSFVYIENQFTSATRMASELAEQMRRVPSLRVLVVAPKLHSSWLESQAMQNGRGAFIDCFSAAGIADRIRFVYPVSRSGNKEAAVMVHSKLMVVDDRILRIGSANLNNRSMGADSECDLIFEAESEEHRDFIASVRRRLIAHFCGLDEQAVTQNEHRLFAVLDQVSKTGGAKTLRKVESSVLTSTLATLVQPVADPELPLHLERAASRMWSTKTIIGIASIALALLGLALAWSYTSLSDYADAGHLSSFLSAYAQSGWGPPFAIAAFVLGGLVIFPVLVLIAATAAALGPWLGFVTAMAGVLLSALMLFAIGRFLGRERLQRLLGRRAARIQERVVGKGILAVVVIRMIPIAPFSLVNVAAGASTLPLRDFMVGTLLGMMPGILAMAVLGAQIADLARNASLSNIALLALAFLGWLGICAGAQFVATWLAGRR